MTPNSEQHCQSYAETCFDAVDMEQCNLEKWDADMDNIDEDDDWKRLVRYIAIGILFFYILFKYLI